MVRRNRGVRLLAAGVVAAVAGAAVVGVEWASAAVLAQESFAGQSTTPGLWAAPSPRGTHSPCLTAAAAQPPAGSLGWCNAVRDGKAKPDPDGQGVFQITDNSKDDAGALILDKAINARDGVHAEFDMYQYGTSTSRGADGLSFFLIDGSVKAPTVGESGGWLGYRNLPGAFVGVGFDEFGNFSNSKYWPAGDKGPAGPRPNSVVLRGAQSTNYQYVKGATAPAGLAVDQARTRGAAKRTVYFDVSTKDVATVSVDFHDGKGPQTLLDSIDLDHVLPNQPALPATVKLGFAASTGSATAFHEISNFKLRTLDPDLNVTVTNPAPLGAGGTGTYQIAVGNSEAAGPTVGPVSTTFKVPDGLTPKAATGDGWSCQISGQNVTCTRPGTGADALRPGAQYPPVKVEVAVPPGAPASVTAQASVDTPNEQQQTDNISPPLTTPIVPAAAPNLRVVIDGTGNFVPGGVGALTATVSNATSAGPTTTPTTLTIPIPDGLTVTGVRGDGWRCTSGSAQVTCTRADVLAPGGSFPPVVVATAARQDLAAPVKATATVGTKGDSDPGDDTARPVTLPKPGLQVGMTITPSPYQAGDRLDYTITVTNTGDTDAADVHLLGDVAHVWGGMPWTCEASAGSTCPGQTGTGAIDTLFGVAKGGTVVFKASCRLPQGITQVLVGGATIRPAAGSADPNCAKGCSVTVSAMSNASRRHG